MNNKIKLPITWEWASLIQIIDSLESGSRPKGGVRNIKKGIPSIGGEHLVYGGSFNFDKIRFIPFEFYQQMTKGLIQLNDVLVVKDGATTGKTALIDQSFPYRSAAVNEHVFILRTNIVLMIPRYIFHWLQSLMGQECIRENMSGTAQGGINSKFIKNSQLPIAPLPEQHRIVAKIEELFTKLDAGVAALKQAQAQLKRYKQSVLKAAVEGRLTADWREQHKDEYEPADKLLERIQDERKAKLGKKYKEPVPVDTSDLPELPEGWVICKSDLLLEFVTSGSRGWAKYYSNEGVLFIRMGNLSHDSIKIDFENVQRVNLPENVEGLRSKLRNNDILISITADVGMVGVVDKDIEETYINQHVALVRPVKLVSAKFLAWYLTTRDGGQKQFRLQRRGATKEGLGLDDIKNVNIPLPPILEQLWITREIEQIFSIVDDSEQVIESELKRAQSLRQSILKRAFKGKLVPQDPNDEPASELLQRIKSQKDRDN